MAGPTRIAATKPLAELPLVPTKVHLPRPVEIRLESLVQDLMDRARDLGEVTRGELIGSLLLAREANEALVDDVRSYRRATAGEAVPGVKHISVPPRRRGRPRRRG